VTPRVFVKTGPPGLLAAEASGLDWLRVEGGPPLPEVIEVTGDRLVLEWIEPGRPSAAVAAEFGRRLARMHATCQDVGAQSSRARPDKVQYGAAQDGFIGPLPLDNTRHDDWPTFYAERRLAPYLRGLDGETRRAVQAVVERLPEIAGRVEPPARIHGDLWSGNVLWSADGQAWLIDASSAHFGHRETDLAMLALFGAPFLDEILHSYDEVAPLADGWRERVPLHQLHPLLVHVQLFGGGYVQQLRTAARRALSL
jgi:fructosamine-3-kinase